jgi:hypothetical protein
MTNFPAVLYGFEISSAMFRVRILETMVSMTIFHPKRGEVGENWRGLLRSFIIYITQQILFELSKQRYRDGRAM